MRRREYQEPDDLLLQAKERYCWSVVCVGSTGRWKYGDRKLILRYRISRLCTSIAAEGMRQRDNAVVSAPCVTYRVFESGSTMQERLPGCNRLRQDGLRVGKIERPFSCH